MHSIQLLVAINKRLVQSGKVRIIYQSNIIGQKWPKSQVAVIRNPLQRASLLQSSTAVTSEEHLQLCCKLQYKPRRVKSKGAILVLILNFLTVNVFNDPENQDEIRAYICIMTFGLNWMDSRCLYWTIQSDGLQYLDQVDCHCSLQY